MQHRLIRENNKFILIKKAETKTKLDKALLIIGLVGVISILGVLKYTNFFASRIFSMLGKPYEEISFIVPLGISFYTFTLITYLVDTYKLKYEAETNIFKFLLFVTYFPKVIQGPITSIDKCQKAHLYDDNKFSDVDLLEAFKRFAFGVSKKFIIADTLAVYVNYIWENHTSINSGYLLLATFLYSIQLYCDFSGYIDMGLSVSRLFNVKLEENFNVPYLSKDVGEFWRRWHITLGNFLKNYIYIPLGGNRVNKFRWILNILVVWLISGLWHGAGTNFIIWGLYFGLLVLISSIVSKKFKEHKKSRYIDSLKIILTFLLVNFGWIFFRAANLDEACSFITSLFSHFNLGGGNIFEIIEVHYGFFITALLLLLIFIVSYFVYIYIKDHINDKTKNILNIASLIFIGLCFSYGVILHIYLGGLGLADAFIYFQF